MYEPIISYDVDKSLFPTVEEATRTSNDNVKIITEKIFPKIAERIKGSMVLGHYNCTYTITEDEKVCDKEYIIAYMKDMGYRAEFIYGMGGDDYFRIGWSK